MALRRLILSLILIALGLTLVPACAASATIGHWQRLGPEGGRVDSLVFSPGYARNKKVFAGTEGGVFRSDNAAQSWTKMTVGSASQSVLSIALSPKYNADQTIFATTAAGHYRSADDGQTWTLIKKLREPDGDFPAARLYVSPNYAKDKTVFLSQTDLYKSTNKGRTWKTTLSAVADLVFSPNYAKDKTILAIYEEGEGPDVRLYLSTDRGRAWTEVGAGALGTPDWRNFVAFSPDYANDMTAFFGPTQYLQALFMSTDGARKWSDAGVGEVSHLAFSPQYRADKTVFAGGKAGLFKSTDGGKSWEQTEQGRKLTNVVSITVSPDYRRKKIVYLVRRGQGVYDSADGGKTWSRLSPALKNAGVTALYPSPSYSTDEMILAATREGVYKSTDGGRSWALNNSGLTGVIIGSVAPSPNFGADKTIFAGSQTGLYKSTDGGLNWSRSKKFGGAGTYSWPQVVVSPNFADDLTVFLGAPDGVYKTTNAGLTWTRLRRTRSKYQAPLIAVSPNYAADRTLFASTGLVASAPPSDFLQSRDGGSSWRKIKTAPRGYEFVPTIVAFSPAFTTDKTVFACDSYSILKSTDGGMTFRRLKTTFNNEITNVVLSPDYANDKVVVAVLGTSGYGGTYRSANGGRNWKRYKRVGLFLAFSPNYAFDKTLFMDSLPFPGRIFRSTDDAKTFAPLPRRPERWLQTIVPSPDYARDKTIFAVPGNGVSSFTFAD